MDSHKSHYWLSSIAGIYSGVGIRVGSAQTGECKAEAECGKQMFSYVKLKLIEFLYKNMANKYPFFFSIFNFGRRKMSKGESKR